MHQKPLAAHLLPYKPRGWSWWRALALFAGGLAQNSNASVLRVFFLGGGGEDWKAKSPNFWGSPNFVGQPLILLKVWWCFSFKVGVGVAVEALFRPSGFQSHANQGSHRMARLRLGFGSGPQNGLTVFLLVSPAKPEKQGHSQLG